MLTSTRSTCVSFRTLLINNRLSETAKTLADSLNKVQLRYKHEFISEIFLFCFYFFSIICGIKVTKKEKEIKFLLDFFNKTGEEKNDFKNKLPNSKFIIKIALEIKTKIY